MDDKIKLVLHVLTKMHLKISKESINKDNQRELDKHAGAADAILIAIAIIENIYNE